MEVLETVLQTLDLQMQEVYQNAIETLMDSNEGAMALWVRKCMTDAQNELSAVWKRFADV